MGRSQPLRRAGLAIDAGVVVDRARDVVDEVRKSDEGRPRCPQLLSARRMTCEVIDTRTPGPHTAAIPLPRKVCE
jgi:hypothetical protein